MTLLPFSLSMSFPVLVLSLLSFRKSSLMTSAPFLLKSLTQRLFPVLSFPISFLVLDKFKLFLHALQCGDTVQFYPYAYQESIKGKLRCYEYTINLTA